MHAAASGLLAAKPYAGVPRWCAAQRKGLGAQTGVLHARRCCPHHAGRLRGLARPPHAHWGARAGVGRNAISLPTGSYTVRLATLRLDHTPNTRFAQSLLLQWDNLSGELGVSARLRWMWAAGRELIFALDRMGYTDERRNQLPGQTRATLKLVWNLER